MGTTTCNNHGKTWPGLQPGTWPRGGSYGHYKEDAETFASWGVDYVKMDWCGKKPEDSKTLHTNFSRWMNATGRPMHLELCRGYKRGDPYVAQVANSWRVAGDNWDYWPHTVSTIKSFIGLSHLAGPYNWNYGDFLMTGGAGCNHFKAGEHCPGQTDAEYRTQFSVYVIAASPLIIGTDIRNMTQIMKDAFLNSELLAVNQDYKAPAGDLVGTYTCPTAATGACGALAARRPADAAGCSVRLSRQISRNHPCLLNTTFGCYPENRSMYVSGGCRGEFECDGATVTCSSIVQKGDGRTVCSCTASPTPPAPPGGDDVLLWARHLSDGTVVIGVTNLADAQRTVSIPLASVGFGAGDVVTARDLWARADLPGVLTGSANVTVGAHDTEVWQLARRKQPVRGA